MNRTVTYRLGFALSLCLMLIGSATAQVFFSVPENLSHNPRNTLSYGEYMALDPGGNINLVWADENCPQSYPYTCIGHLFFSRSVDGGATFSIPKDISSHHDGSPLFHSQLAIDGSGNINVVWDDTAFGDSKIFYSRSTDGGATFSIPRLISSYTGSAYDPQIALSAHGNINVVWQAPPPAIYPWWNIFFAGSTDGGATFSSPTSLCNTQEICNWPQIAVDASDAISLTWAKSACNTCNYEVFFSRSNDAGGAFSAPQNLSNSPWPLITSPELLVDGGGNINIVWTMDTPISGDDVFFARSSDKGVSFSTAKSLSGNRGNSIFPQIAADASGNINAIWYDEVLGDTFFSRSIDGGVSFSTPKEIATGFAHMVVDSGGNINLLGGITRDIFVSLSTDGGATFHTSYLRNLSSCDANDCWAPGPHMQMTMDESGNINVILLANSSTGNGDDLFFSRGVTVNSLENDIAGLSGSGFKNKGVRKAMLNKVAHINQALVRGDAAFAGSELQDLLQHVDGCGLSPDSNDWIVDCTAQVKIRTSIKIIIDGIGE